MCTIPSQAFFSSKTLTFFVLDMLARILKTLPVIYCQYASIEAHWESLEPKVKSITPFEKVI